MAATPSKRTAPKSASAQLKAGPPAPPVTPPVWTPPNSDESPIPGSTAFKVTKMVNLGQLEAELSTALGAPSLQAVLVGPQDRNQPLDETNYYVLWLMPSSANEMTVYRVIADHQPDQNWGVPTVVRDFEVVWQKLLADPEAPLTNAEQLSLLRGLVFRAMTQQG